MVLLLALTQYGVNRLAPDGSFLLDNLVPFDTAFHVGLTHELVAGYPPQVPGVSGLRLGYHLGPDLVRAAALRWAGVDPWDCLSRFDVTLWALALVPLLRTTATRLAFSPRAVALVPWSLLLTDFSFLFAGNPSAHWWTDMLRGNILLSLTLSNPLVPALGLFLGALVALSRYEEGEGHGFLGLAALLGLALPFFKVFLGAHFLLGLGLLVLLRAVRRLPVRSLALAATPCALATATLALGQGASTVRVTFVPLDLVTTTIQTLGLAPATGLRLALWTLFWVLASLGLRSIGLPRAVRCLLAASPVGTPLAVVALTAWPLGLLLHVSAPEVLAGQTVVNDAAYLVEQGGPVLWIFAVAAVDTLAGTGMRRVLCLALAAGLSLPSTFQFVLAKATLPTDPVPAAMMRGAQALRLASRPGEVVLQRPGARYPPAPVVFAGRRVPYERFTPYLTQFASREVLLERHDLVWRFFRATDPADAMAIAHTLDARYLALWGHDRVRFDTSGLLLPIHEEPGARIYRLVLDD
jgi:hypothetical protein